MKNRLLPFGFLTLFLGISLLLFSNLIIAGTPDETPGKSGIDRMQQIRANQLTGTINPVDVLNARTQLGKLKTKSTAGLGLDWKLLGPDNAAGRMNTLIFDNRDASGQTIYTGGVIGGVWKSTNLGLTWSPVDGNGSEILRVSAMVQTPSGIIYVGTGESVCGSVPYLGTGLYRSEDGITYTQIPTAKPAANDPSSDWNAVIRLVCSASGRLFAATNKGIRYSDDGNTWTSLKDGNPSDIAVGSDGTLLFAVDGAVYLAPAGNLQAVVNLSTGGANALPNSDAGWTTVAIAPSAPDIMYACVAKATTNQLMNVYRSADKGLTWSIIFPGNTTFEPFGTTNNFGTTGACYASTLTVFSDNANMVLLGGIDGWWGKEVDAGGYFSWEQISFGSVPAAYPAYAPSYHHQYAFQPGMPTKFAIATDNGISVGTVSPEGYTFQTSNRNLVTSQFASFSITTETKNIMAGGKNVGTQMIGPFSINTPEDGYQIWTDNGAANQGGTGSFSAWSMINPNAVFYSQAGANPPYRRSDDLGVTVSPTFLGGDTGIGSNLTQTPPICFWESFDFENTRDSVKYYATDNTHEAGSTVVVESRNAKFPFEYVLPVTVTKGDSLMVPDPVQSRFFLYGTKVNSGIWMTKDALVFNVDPTWFQVATTDLLTCITVSKDLNYLWAGTAGGRIYRVGNLALAHDYNTADVSSPYCIVSNENFSYSQFVGRYVTSIAISPNDNNKVMVTLGNYGNNDYVYITQNALDSLPVFQSAQGNLPKMPVYSGIFEMSNTNRVILGTDMGVFSTDNVTGGSPAWAEDITGMGGLPVTMLKQQQEDFHTIHNYGCIYASTYGLGLYFDSTFYTPLGINPGAGKTEAGTINITPNPTRDKVKLSYTLDHSGSVNLAVYDVTGRTVLNFSLGTQKEGEHSFTADLSALPAGTYFVTIGNANGKIVKIQ